jgi:hypothetical protein
MTDRPPISARDFVIFLRVLAIVTVIATWFVVLRFADDEPFRVFSASQAIFYVGFGSVVFAMGLYLALAICYGFLTRRLGLMWLPVLFLVGIGLLYSRYSVVHYLRDITHFVVRQ